MRYGFLRSGSSFILYAYNVWRLSLLAAIQLLDLQLLPLRRNSISWMKKKNIEDRLGIIEAMRNSIWRLL